MEASKVSVVRLRLQAARIGFLCFAAELLRGGRSLEKASETGSCVILPMGAF